MALRIVFCGTPAFAVPTLGHLIAQPDFAVEAVVTQPDRGRGRGQHPSPSPVKAVAQEHVIAVQQPEKIRVPEMHDYIRSLAPDVVVIIAYGQIIPRSLIEIPRLGWINLHASLLPRYRGAAPIQWAIMRGEAVTGLTTMRIDASLDTGPILLQQELSIGRDETAPELASRLAEAGGPLVAGTLRRLDSGEIAPRAQEDSQATHAPLLTKADGLLDWSSSASEMYNRMRGLQPWPGAFTSFRGVRCNVWGKPAPRESSAHVPGTIFSAGDDWFVACGNATALRLEFLQLESRKRVTASEFAAGARLQSGERLGES